MLKTMLNSSYNVEVLGHNAGRYETLTISEFQFYGKQQADTVI